MRHPRKLYIIPVAGCHPFSRTCLTVAALASAERGQATSPYLIWHARTAVEHAAHALLTCATVPRRSRFVARSHEPFLCDPDVQGAIFACADPGRRFCDATVADGGIQVTPPGLRAWNRPDSVGTEAGTRFRSP